MHKAKYSRSSACAECKWKTLRLWHQKSSRVPCRVSKHSALKLSCWSSSVVWSSCSHAVLLLNRTWLQNSSKLHEFFSFQLVLFLHPPAGVFRLIFWLSLQVAMLGQQSTRKHKGYSIAVKQLQMWADKTFPADGINSGSRRTEVNSEKCRAKHCQALSCSVWHHRWSICETRLGSGEPQAWITRREFNWIPVPGSGYIIDFQSRKSAEIYPWRCHYHAEA